MTCVSSTGYRPSERPGGEAVDRVVSCDLVFDVEEPADIALHIAAASDRVVRAERLAPARFVAVYAPGLNPMDFHAIFEAWFDGAWWAYDATHQAPRESMVRVATGRDAADTAFLNVL